jgi:hypothetical protein
LTLIGFFCLLLAFGVWLAVVAPVNSDVAHALRSAPESVPMLWLRLRNAAACRILRACAVSYDGNPKGLGE